MKIETLCNVVHETDDGEQHHLSGIAAYIGPYRYTLLENDMHVYVEVYTDGVEEDVQWEFFPKSRSA